MIFSQGEIIDFAYVILCHTWWTRILKKGSTLSNIHLNLSFKNLFQLLLIQSVFLRHKEWLSCPWLLFALVSLLWWTYGRPSVHSLGLCSLCVMSAERQIMIYVYECRIVIVESTPGQPLETGFWENNPTINTISVLCPAVWRVECQENELIMSFPLPTVTKRCAFSRFRPRVLLTCWSEFWDWGGTREDRPFGRRAWGSARAHPPLFHVVFVSKSRYTPYCQCWWGTFEWDQGRVTGICSHLGGSLQVAWWTTPMERGTCAGRMLPVSLSRRKTG